MTKEIDNIEDTVNIPIEKLNKTNGFQESKLNSSSINPNAKWIDNQGNEIEKVFGFTDNAELVNGRAAMFGFIMLILTELVFKGEAATKSIFGIG